MAEHAEKLRDILARLNAAGTVADMRMPGFQLHPLKECPHNRPIFG